MDSRHVPRSNELIWKFQSTLRTNECTKQRTNERTNDGIDAKSQRHPWERCATIGREELESHWRRRFDFPSPSRFDIPRFPAHLPRGSFIFLGSQAERSRNGGRGETRDAKLWEKYEGRETLRFCFPWLFPSLRSCATPRFLEVLRDQNTPLTDPTGLCTLALATGGNSTTMIAGRVGTATAVLK